ncbi:MAG: diadenylate cyclase CdaA [Selenomonadaceae bacterium]|nr:diadenylate cyclase CdaA [Selenomonadaceae bacterium]MBQ7723521.1 diadenylate cyclase CdaA [Selenomonadaceae bacterium]
MPLDFEIASRVRDLVLTMTPLDIFDIIIVAMILYKSYLMIQDTRAITLVKGLMVIIFLTIICGWLNLHVMTWLLQKSSEWLLIALPILFQPELRRALERLGQGKFFTHASTIDRKEADSVVDELVKTAKKLSQTKTGALMVIEREMKLNDISYTGIHIDGIISTEFLLNVFIVNTPLHDGAAIIRGNRLISAACVLPLTENTKLSTELGTRHRAAIGLSEQCDALIIVVSEETGTISVAEGGRLMRHFDEQTLAAKIRPAFVQKEDKFFDKFLSKWRDEK